LGSQVRKAQFAFGRRNNVAGFLGLRANGQRTSRNQPNSAVCSFGYYDYAPYACAPSGFYGLAISMAASSWASAHGRTGAMATAGAVIASAVAEEEAIAAPVETVVDVFLPPYADMAQRLYAPATRPHLTERLRRTPTPQRRIVSASHGASHAQSARGGRISW